MIEMTSANWVTGTRAAGYYGPVRAQAEELDDCLAALREAAQSLGANGVVAVEVTANPFPEKDEATWCAVGTAAKLEAWRP